MGHINELGQKQIVANELNRVAVEDSNDEDWLLLAATADRLARNDLLSEQKKAEYQEYKEQKKINDARLTDQSEFLRDSLFELEASPRIQALMGYLKATDEFILFGEWEEGITFDSSSTVGDDSYYHDCKLTHKALILNENGFRISVKTKSTSCVMDWPTVASFKDRPWTSWKPDDLETETNRSGFLHFHIEERKILPLKDLRSALAADIDIENIRLKISDKISAIAKEELRRSDR